MTNLPQPIPRPDPVPDPEDVPYQAPLKVHIDATDVRRRILRVRERIPVSGPGPMTLLYAKWLPGYHAPQAPIELFAGLVITANGRELTWVRHPVTVNAFRVEVPEGVEALEAEFQFLTPTQPSQGRVTMSSALLALQWNTVVLYPAGHFVRRIEVDAALTLPAGWHFATVLDVTSTEDLADGSRIQLERVSLATLVDSPLFAGLHFRRIELDDAVSLNLVADRPELLEATREQIAAHREVVIQSDHIFGARHFDRFSMLLALSDELTGAGIEHHRSFDAVSLSSYFTDWSGAMTRHSTVPHEYVHSWNGKHRRGADSWSPCFEWPIRNSLMWVYEGQTQYWTHVLCARSGLWSLEESLGALAHVAATYDLRPGSRWRPMIDTTRDPIIAARSPLPWVSWQRSEDYYGEGALLWLDVDTRLREMTGEARSLDDFAFSFFGAGDAAATTHTYVYEDIVKALQEIAPFDWYGFLHEQVTGKREGAPLDGISRGGYELVFRDHPNPYAASLDRSSGVASYAFSLGLVVGNDGTLSEVVWESPAFAAGLVVGAQILAVNGLAFAPAVLRRAVADSAGGGALRLLVKAGQEVREARIEYNGGARYPHLQARAESRRRIDEILSARR